MIQGHGSSTPRIMLISDAAYGEDLRTNRAITGYAGSMIDGWLKENRINESDIWKTCLIKEEAPKDLYLDESGEKVERLIKLYDKILLDEINTLRPNLLIPLGEHSFRYFTGLRNIRKFRGSVLPVDGNFHIEKIVKVLPILGLYPYVNQEYRLRVITRIDFAKILKNATEGPPPDNLFNIWVARSSSALRAFFERAYEKCTKERNFLVFDIETYMQIPICISFCFDGYESVCVPLIDRSIDFDQRVLMMQLVSRMLNSPIPKVNQNIKYDWKIMERWGFHVRNIIGDTMLAASTLYCEFPKNLGFLTSIYTDIPYFKDEGKEFDPNRDKKDRYYLYNAKDSLATSQIYLQQKDELNELGTKKVYDNLIKLMPIYTRMENRGIRIDEEQQLCLLAKYESCFHIEELKAKQLLNVDYFNILSNKQCRKAIFEELGYKKIRGVKTTQSGDPSTDEDSLELLYLTGEATRAPSTGPLVLKSIINARKFHKVIEVLQLHLHPDKRFKCEYNLAGTETGRSSAGETTDQLIYLDENGKVRVTNLGHSLQTIGKHGFMVDGVTYGKDLRLMFVPSYGYVFVENDLSGAEARVDRVLSGNFDMVVFDNPGIHKLTGSWCFDCKPEDIKKNQIVPYGNVQIDRYHVAKQVRHAGERNITAAGLVTKLLWGLTVKQGQTFLDLFHKNDPSIRQVFHKEVIRALDDPTHCLIAPNGRRRDFFDRIQRSTYNEAFSFLPQAIVSDQTKFSLISTLSEAPWALLLAEQHDGTLAEVPRGKEFEYISIYKKNVETPIDFRFCTLHRDYQLIIPCESSVGENWFAMEEMRI